MFFSLATQPPCLTGFSDPLKCNLAFGAACLSLDMEEAVICESKIAPLSMPRGTGVFEAVLKGEKLFLSINKEIRLKYSNSVNHLNIFAGDVTYGVS